MIVTGWQDIWVERIPLLSAGRMLLGAEITITAVDHSLLNVNLGLAQW
jgi:hypothetical protein